MNANMLDTPLVLEKVVKVPKHVKEVKAKKKVKVKEVPKGFKAENITDKAVELSWAPVKGKEVKYQAVMKKAGLFNRSTETVYEGIEAKCIVDNLEQ